MILLLVTCIYFTTHRWQTVILYYTQVANSFVILLLVTCIWAVLGTQLFHKSNETEFGAFGDALFTMFQARFHLSVCLCIYMSMYLYVYVSSFIRARAQRERERERQREEREREREKKKKI